VGPETTLAKMDSATTDPISIAGRGTNFSTPATVISNAPGVRVKVGQLVTVLVRFGPVPTPAPAPTPPGRSRPR
jgi:hypothetical protein